MRQFLAVVALLLAAALPAETYVPKTVVVSQQGATLAEVHAAHELRDTLAKITGVDIPIRIGAVEAPANAIVVGPGPVARKLFPDIKWELLGEEQTLIRSKGETLLVAGGQPRGVLYAVYRLLQEKCGVRWWTPWATTIPANPKLRIGDLNWSETPAFEYRDSYWAQCFDKDWAARNFDNGFNVQATAETGGKILYQGFVHTYYGLVPPDPNFASHPEWFSLVNGQRTHDNAQLCTTNRQLRDYVVEQVRKELRANPKARIVSVSQNDCFNPCQCPECRALAASQGSDAALVLDLANYVGEKIEKEFPNVAVDTLAYQWSRHPVKTMKPRPNVIVRLCSIECNFAYPLDSPQNASFGDDIRGWSKLTQRLYVWDYCTNFANYLQPQPDYFTLGPTIKFFAGNGVKGVFEEGDYTSNGGDMAELKAWLIAQMLWDPKQDPDKLIDEFLAGYYGPASKPIRQYLQLMQHAAESVHLSFALGSNTPFLSYDTMHKALDLWLRARSAVASQPEYLWRVNQSFLSVQYVYLTHWQEFKLAALSAHDPWLLDASRKAEADKWLAVLEGKNGENPSGWSPVTAIDEGGTSPQAFAASLGADPPEPVFHSLPERNPNPAPPQGLANGVDLQDNLAHLWQAPLNSELRGDPLASDGIACWMPGTHHEWAFQLPISAKKNLVGRYSVYVVARLDTGERDGSPGFSAGVYDGDAKRDLVSHTYAIDQTAPGYKAYDLGTFDLKPGCTIWVAPTSNPNVQAVWVDRVYLVPANSPQNSAQ